MTSQGRGQRDAGQEGAAFLALVRRLASFALATLVAAGFPFAGLPASFAVLLGGGLMGLALFSLAKGLEQLLRSGESSTAGRNWALAALVPRQALLALAFFIAVVPLALPPAWLLAGVTAWPVAFVAAALLTARLPAAALIAATTRVSDT